MNTKEFTNELEYLIRARYSAICINSFEEERAFDLINKLSFKLNKRIITWSSTKGLIVNNNSIQNSLDLRQAIIQLEELASEPTIFIFFDIHTFLKNQPVIIRAFREICQKLRSGFPSNILLITSELEIPNELQKEITILDLPLPNLEEVKQTILNFSKNYENRNELKILLDNESLELLSQASLGLSKSEIENCLAKSLVKNRRISNQEVNLILAEKKQIIRKTNILEYVSVDSLNLSKIGGLENLKKWLSIRKLAFSNEAVEFGIKAPKGVLLIGVPGCGKSLSAKCVSTFWNLPLLKLDMGRIFSGIVGSSEANIRHALKLAEAISPCILWIDEIEKGLSGSNSGSSDGGAATRVFGHLLTWMQEKIAPVFVFATANNIKNLPPELLRKGRFDEIFFVDLPSYVERKEIFSIIIDKLNRSPQNYNLDNFSNLTGEAILGEDIRFTGSEIESVVNDALLESFYSKSIDNKSKELTDEHIELAITRIIPLAKSRKEEIKSLREWAAENAVRASLVNDQKFESNQSNTEISFGRNIDF